MEKKKIRQIMMARVPVDIYEKFRKLSKGNISHVICEALQAYLDSKKIKGE